MRKPAALLSLFVLAAGPGSLSAQYGLSTGRGGLGGLCWQLGPSFDVAECTTSATHILVVDRRGRVLEVWKGNAKPGDWIPIDRFYRSELARPGCFTLLDQYDFASDPSLTSDRLILFLVKSGEADPRITFLDGWLPAATGGWFACSTARVNSVGGVYVEPRRHWLGGTGILDCGLQGSEWHFKEDVMWLLNRVAPPTSSDR